MYQQLLGQGLEKELEEMVLEGREVYRQLLGQEFGAERGWSVEKPVREKWRGRLKEWER